MQIENKKRMPQQAPQAKADKAPAEQDTALVWGKNPVTELLKSEAGVDTLLLADSMEPRMAGYYTALGKAAGAVIKRVPAGKLQKLCGTQDHQGVAAWAARIQYVGVEELLQIAKDRGEPPFLVLCDGIEDPHNLGAILRSALLCGAHGVIIPRRGGVGVTGTVMKSSAGAAARIPVARVANLPQAIRDLKKAEHFCLLCRPGRCSAGKNRSFRSGGAGAGQRGRRPRRTGAQTVRCRRYAGYGRWQNRCGQL